MQMFQLLGAYRHSSDRNSWSSRYPSFGDIPMTSFDTDGLVMSNISGPIYMNPDTFETAYLFYTNWPSDHTKQVNPLTKTAYFWNRSPEWIFLGPTGFSETRYFWSQQHHKLWSSLKWKLSSSKWQTTITHFKLKKTYSYPDAGIF